MRSIVILAVVPLAACATTSTADLRQLPVAGTYKSAKAPDVLAACLADNMNKWGAPSVYKAGDETTVSFTSEGNTMLLFTIRPGSTIEVRRATGLVTYKEKTEACL
jgi:hypothetical protein